MMNLLFSNADSSGSYYRRFRLIRTKMPLKFCANYPNMRIKGVKEVNGECLCLFKLIARSKWNVRINQGMNYEIYL